MAAMPAKVRQNGWGIWLYRRPLRHRILRFLLLQRGHLFADLRDLKPFSLLTSFHSGSKPSSLADLPADSLLSSRFSAWQQPLSHGPLPPSGERLKEHEKSTFFRAPLHAADGHSECASCLGPAHVETALTKTECPHCKDISLCSLRSIAALQLSFQRIKAHRDEWAYAGSDPAYFTLSHEKFFPSFSPAKTSIHLRLRAKHGLVQGKWRWGPRWQRVTGCIASRWAVMLALWLSVIK